MPRLIIALDMPDTAETLDPDRFMAALGLQRSGRYGWDKATAHWASESAPLTRDEVAARLFADDPTGARPADDHQLVGVTVGALLDSVMDLLAAHPQEPTP